MNTQRPIVDKVRNFALTYFFGAFSLVFYTSWIYEVAAFGPGTGEYFGFFKSIFILGFMLLMSAGIRWEDVKPDVFGCACLIWLVFCVAFWFQYQDAATLYRRRIGQIIFVFLFVTFLRQNPKKNPAMGGAINKWFSPWIVFAVLLIAVALNLTEYLSVDINNGFGNSRVNFSIWLMQVIALVLILKLTDTELSAKILVICLLLITPAFILQNMTGGRSGLLGTFLLVSLFAFRWGGLKALFAAVIWLYAVALVVATYHPLITPENNLNAFRNLEVSHFSTLNELIVWVDKLSSYRLSILITAFSSLDARGLLFGVGLGNFVGWAPTYPELGIVEVHNVFLKIWGEFGVFGFLTALVLAIWPIAYRPRNEKQRLAVYLQAIYFLVAMVHPDLMMTAINLSFVYLSYYAYSAGLRRSAMDVRHVHPDMSKKNC